MKKIIVIMLVLAMLFTLIGCAKPAEVAEKAEVPAVEEIASLEDLANDYFASFPGARIIKWEDLAVKIEAGDEPFVLSIRQQDVYDAGHVESAYLAAWGQDLADKVAMLPTDETVYVYCYSGQTAGQAVALMNILGIDAVSVKSGFNYGITKTDGHEAYVETAA
jgi:rhodanese-related sulfurtransferase